MCQSKQENCLYILQQNIFQLVIKLNTLHQELQKYRKMAKNTSRKSRDFKIGINITEKDNKICEMRFDELKKSITKI